MSETDRERDLETIRATYRRYDAEGRSRLWDPGNPGYAWMMRDREAALTDLIRRSLPERGGHVLDLGAGDGGLATVVRRAGMPIQRWVGVDLDPAAMAAARVAIPWGDFFEASADRLPFGNAAFDVVVASTLFSSLPARGLEEGVAGEIARVLRPGGWLVWYDIRYGNPANRAVHGVGRGHLRSLFPDWTMELASMTLLPPVARRLGTLTQVLYGPLHALPFLRSHLVGRLQPPGITSR